MYRGEKCAPLKELKSVKHKYGNCHITSFKKSLSHFKWIKVDETYTWKYSYERSII